MDVRLAHLHQGALLAAGGRQKRIQRRLEQSDLLLVGQARHRELDAEIGEVGAVRLGLKH